MSEPPSESAIVAAMAGLVVEVMVERGQRVEVGDTLCVTETMKCESNVVVEVAGWVSRIASLGTTTGAGDVLAIISAFPPWPERAVWSPAAVVGLLCAERGGAHASVPEAASGRFVEYDLVDGELTAVDRPIGEQRAGVVIGIVSHTIRGHLDPLDRVLICSDPMRSMGALAEAECRAVMAAMDLAAERGLSIEWVAVSSGARIAWDSGTENMDWCAAVARHIVRFTQAGGAINVIVAGVNVGAQSYWNALATMLWHTAGMLVMVAEDAMVLTGRRALELSGGGRHDTEAEMGAYAEVMGPNGEAQHVVSDLPGGYRVLFDHLALCEPRRDGSPPHSPTADDPNRSMGDAVYEGPGGFTSVGQILEQEHNPARKLPFAIRPVMAALADSDGERLEPWRDQAGAQSAVVWDTRLGGWPVTLIGVESHPVVDHSSREPRLRASGTLFPQASRKIARAINAASGRHGTIVLANLAGFDGSAESMRGRQLEYGAEIARAVVNYQGPIIVVIIGRFHGGAYVVFSRRLNPNVTVIALEGTFVSVIGGEAAAGVVFAREVKDAVAADLADSALTGPELLRYRAEREVFHRTRVGRRFDEVHSVDRALEVGSVDSILHPRDLRGSIIKLLDDWQPHS